jgi:hypothetical protein
MAEMLNINTKSMNNPKMSKYALPFSNKLEKESDFLNNVIAIPEQLTKLNEKTSTTEKAQHTKLKKHEFSYSILKKMCVSVLKVSDTTNIF